MKGRDDLGTSVLLPVLWRAFDPAAAALLRRALRSIEDQDWPGPHEILLIDDGSPTPIEAHRDALGSPEDLANVRFIRCERNGRLVHALNVGLAEARHPFVARMDADDRWAPGKIAAQFALFESDPALTLVGTGMRLLDERGAVTGALDLPCRWEEILRYYVDVGCPFAHGSILARRDVFRAIGGYPHDPRTFHCEDFATWGRWIRFFKVGSVAAPLYEYTVSDQSVSALNRYQQKWATDRLRTRMSDLEPVERIPRALAALAEACSLDLIAAGRLAHDRWSLGEGPAVPPEAVGPLRFLLADRASARDSVA